MVEKKHDKYNKASDDRTPFLFIGESMCKRVNCIDDEGAYSYYIWPVTNPDKGQNDRVLLDIYTETKKLVLTGGNPLTTDVLEGQGKLHMVYLKDGSATERELEVDMRVVIPTDNVIYWYENTGDVNLLIRDTCSEFDNKNEPSLQAVAQALVSLVSR